MKKTIITLLTAITLSGIFGFQTQASETSELFAEQLSKLPESVMTSIVDNGWTIQLTDESLSAKYFDGMYTHVQGVTVSWEKSIWISNDTKSISESTLHEVGHYIDYINGMVSDTDAFYEVFKAERRSFVSSDGGEKYAKTSTTEYFAETCKEYFVNPINLATYAPMTYGFIDSYLTSVGF